ncbi:DNA-binding protein WhiA [Ureaplasma ceti]|uniref:Probable cell division protein WhiA n=1 Tax=Ureaplasma ceti TaxID=3119530 RepID=A0ABP9U6E8_9BACT
MKLDEQNLITFSETVKNEISKSEDITEVEKEYLTFSMLRNTGDYLLFEDIYELRTRYVSVIKLLKSVLTNEKYNCKITLFKSNKKTLKDNKTDYILRIEPKDINQFNELLDFNELLTELNDFEQQKTNSHELELELDSEKMKGFLMGAFLSSGSINNPQKGQYHFEIRTSSEAYKNLLCRIFNVYNLEPKTLFRRNRYIVYFKKSAQISDILKILKSQNAMFHFEDVIIGHDFTNNMQRLVNLDVCNMNKSSKAGAQQSTMCKVILTSFHFSTLKEREKLYCKLRAQNPNLSMVEMCEEMNKRLPEGEEITKGSLSHIVKKIKDIYAKI